MPTDDGKPRADGYTRSDHLRDHVYWVLRAKAEGVDVIGYNYWSLTDNFEWGSYRPRFGLYTVDVLDDPALARKPTDAVRTYREIIAADGLPAGYRPVR
jgi:beta-glucosidase